MNKFFALVRRALQTESRLARGHGFRCLLGIFVLWTLVTTRWEVFNRGAPGLNLFRSMSYYNYFFITILGTAYFATAITEEKEERTLGLLKMAGVGATSLIMGKWTPRMISAFLLLSVQIPFTVLAITLGGVLWQQIGAVYFALFAHLFFVGSLGLFCSVLMSTTTGACLLALGSLLGMSILPLIATGLFRNASGSLLGDMVLNLASFFRSMHAFQSIGFTLSTGFNSSWWSIQVISNLIVGGIILAVTWAIFDICTRNEKEAGGLGYFDRLRKRLQSKGRGRVWSAALVWKDYQLLGGGGIFLFLKFALYFGFVLFFALGTGISRSRMLENLGWTLIGWSLFFFVFETAIMTARLYRNEMSNKTWATLIMLPRSSKEMIYSKLIGGMTTTLPVVACFCIGVVLTPDDFFDALGSIMSEAEAVLGVSYFVMQIVIAIHLSTYFSISQKWAIWPMAVFLSGFIVFIANVTVMGCLFIGISPGDASAILFMGNVAALIITIVIHYNIGKRLIAVAGE
ncbi:hypothetical protein OAF98_03160 [Planctomicrobium sp.]|jgi:ABC-type transport system involved in multi-copper enzyme maturation permease subunit|nr:hypothetical protein [Planctomicrobium sp.]MBT5020359.1 hypothetical protein [Planctomicrobium sp.]MDA7527362.1 hypothetical protein [bacterium]MDB4733147.1 hypothetical protein [Planctomicrobium sp.]MDB4743461.1 hypothetical protein [Planctomicrobium sp.]